MLQRSPEVLEALEEAICTHAGDLVRACQSLSINPRELHQWALADPSIHAAIKTAQMIGWASLESEAYRRAVLGVKKAVYYKGEVCGYEDVYSDGLLQTLLKARVPGYSTEDSTHKGLTVNVAIMPRASTYEEWLDHRDSQLCTSEASTQEPVVSAANDTQLQIEDASFTEVSGLRDVL